MITNKSITDSHYIAFIQEDQAAQLDIQPDTAHHHTDHPVAPAVTAAQADPEDQADPVDQADQEAQVSNCSRKGERNKCVFSNSRI